MIPDKILKKARAHNAVCDRLIAEGYTIQGCTGYRFDKCYFAGGEYPNQKIAGYIDSETLEIIWLDRNVGNKGKESEPSAGEKR